MRQLADFVNRMMADSTGRGSTAQRSQGRSGRAIGVIGIPGDRRDDDQREYGALATTAFDEIIVREDKNLRGRQPGETAQHVVEGIHSARGSNGHRPARSEKILNELTAVRTAMRRASRGDLVVVCVDDAIAVYREAMSAAAASRGGTAFADPGELEAPEG
jgi:cyanophycin synthetase